MTDASLRPYIVIELPSNLLLKVSVSFVLNDMISFGVPQRVGPNVLLPAIVTVWGLVTTLQGWCASSPTAPIGMLTSNPGLVTSFGGLVACRFFLGLTEGESSFRPIVTQ